MAGGGGGSGTIDTGVKKAAQMFLYGSCTDVANYPDSGDHKYLPASKSLIKFADDDLAGSGPLSSATAWDPDSVISTMESDANSYGNVSISGLLEDVSDELQTLYGTVLGEVKTRLQTTYLGDVLDAEEAVADSEFEREELPRFEAAMGKIGASMSSSFLVGKAKLEMNLNKRLVDVNQDIRLRNLVLLHQTSVDLISSVMSMWRSYIDWNKSVALMKTDVQKTKIALKVEESDSQLIIDEKDATWKFEVFGHVGNFAAASFGGVEYDEGPSSIMKGFGGALSGAGVGAMLGSGVPVIGSGVGAMVGALVGGISSLL